MKIKKHLLIPLTLLLTLSLTGCWNYYGLDHMTIVTGLAIDKAENNLDYHITFEIIDMIESNKTEGIKTKLVESEGTTIFEAVRNAKKRITNKLYFANTEIVIINEDIAKKEGIQGVINFLLRDAEGRETINVVIAKNSSAKDIIGTKGLGNTITSYEISEIIKDDNKITSFTIEGLLYNTYNVLNSNGISLALPAIHITNNEDKSAIEAAGIAIFNKDKLIGYLNSNDAKPFLFVKNKVNGGIIAVSTNNNENSVSLEISEATTQKSYNYNNDKIVFNINIKIKAYLGESMVQKENLSEKQITEISTLASEKINQEVKEVITNVQSNFGTDIFGFGLYIYQHNPNLYNKFAKDWNAAFKKIEIKVDSKINIINTGFIR